MHPNLFLCHLNRNFFQEFFSIFELKFDFISQKTHRRLERARPSEKSYRSTRRRSGGRRRHRRLGIYWRIRRSKVEKGEKIFFLLLIASFRFYSKTSTLRTIKYTL